MILFVKVLICIAHFLSMMDVEIKTSDFSNLAPDSFDHQTLQLLLQTSTLNFTFDWFSMRNKK